MRLPIKSKKHQSSLLDHEEDEDTGIHRVLYKHETKQDEFEITREPDGSFDVSGFKVERLFKMTDFTREESIRRFARQLRSFGVDEALRQKGATDGDIVRILEYEFEFVD